jgi:hypothetical protein
MAKVVNRRAGLALRQPAIQSTTAETASSHEKQFECLAKTSVIAPGTIVPTPAGPACCGISARVSAKPVTGHEPVNLGVDGRFVPNPEKYPLNLVSECLVIRHRCSPRNFFFSDFVFLNSATIKGALATRGA